MKEEQKVDKSRESESRKMSFSNGETSDGGFD